MEITRVENFRKNRSARLQRPYATFCGTLEQCLAAADLVLSGKLDERVKLIVEKSIVISLVSAIEVYFRDILDFIFRYCEPKYFEPHLKLLLPEKFDIVDLLEFHRHGVHPLELTTTSQSFQNTERIDKVFSRFVGGRGLWGSVLETKIRLKDAPEKEYSFSPDQLNALKRIFNLRHEIVHDPAGVCFFTEETKDDLVSASFLMLGADIVLSEHIFANRDPKLSESETR